MGGNLTMSNMFPGVTLAQERTASGLLAMFNFLEIFGFMTVLIVLLVAWLSPHVNRTRVWYSFMASWLLFCMSYFLLAGPASRTPARPRPLPYPSGFDVCCACPVSHGHNSASLTAQLTSSTSFGTLSVLLHLQMFPIISFVLVVIETLVVGLSHSADVERARSGMFCHLKNPIPAKTTAIAVLLASITMVAFEVKTLILLYRNWTAFQKLRVRSNDTVSLPLIIRVCVFSLLLPLIAGVLAAVSFLETSIVEEGRQHLGTALLPTVVGVLFGTQQDILRALKFWRTREADSEKITGSAV
ncbi:hypothetical protein C8F01DRAFT_1119915 [Mycena amicta]|nr:hypothetical protein C8F01DRAFT_1119915 [Mycena amicta]